MDASTGTALSEGGKEEGGAGRGLEGEWTADVRPGGVVHDKHVMRVETLFLDARGCEIDVVFVLDRDAAAGARHPSMSVEVAT